MSLHTRLLEIKANAARYVRPENQSVTDGTIAWLTSSGSEKALKPGEHLPEFTLIDTQGKMIPSQGLAGQGLLVIVFFRGRWCPYCVAQLEALRDAHAKFADAGARLIGVSPQTLRQIDFMRHQHSLNLTLFRDERNQAAQKFGIAYQAPEQQQELYRRSFVNLPFINGEETWTLPMPSIFIADQAGVVRYTSVHADFTERDDPEMLLLQLGCG